MADGTFSPVVAGEKGAAVQGGAVGPSSNTGQKGGALVDYFTAVFPASRLEDFGVSDLRNLLRSLFGTYDELKPLAIREKAWQFYPLSAVIVDREGEMVGRIGLGGNRDTVCVSLSGAGCKWVRHWDRVAIRMREWRGRVTRVDLAFDDYEGERLNVHALRARALAGDFAEGGRPPSHRFLSDEGHDTGCTLYVGGKGHKELCVYEKGKQLGMPSSKWVRCEVRLYGKHVEVPLDVLVRPLDYLRGSYSVLREVIAGACERLKTIARTVEACADAMVRNARRQMGRTVQLLIDAFGPQWPEFVASRIARPGHPGRFRGHHTGDLPALVREQLCPAAS